jgi:hypothetical protein
MTASALWSWLLSCLTSRFITSLLPSAGRVAAHLFFVLCIACCMCLQAPVLTAIAEFIQNLLLLVPWNLTRNFIGQMQGRGMLLLSGASGNPLGSGRGFSFTTMVAPRRVKDQNQKEAEKKIPLPKGLFDTDRDLRKLTMTRLKELLLELGCDEAQVDKWKRWPRVQMIRALASSQAQAGVYAAFPSFSLGRLFVRLVHSFAAFCCNAMHCSAQEHVMKFARAQKQTHSLTAQEYKKDVAKIFAKQVQFLSATTLPDWRDLDDPNASPAAGSAASASASSSASSSSASSASTTSSAASSTSSTAATPSNASSAASGAGGAGSTPAKKEESKGHFFLQFSSFVV